MSGPSVYLTLPPLDRFKLPPDNLPAALPPPSDERTFRSPFAIDAKLYNAVLRPEVPFTFAALYIVGVTLLNAYNRRRNYKKWAIADTTFFHVFVVLHNTLLAIYSVATFIAMFRAVSRVWPGLDQSTGLAGVADAFCKMQGPRGLGDAVNYNSSLHVWETKNKLINLLPDGTPDSTDVGRLWNEGLAFWGWFFYLSKFYEVLDTLIILAKGKRSPLLQTFHHAGAMQCMWAGIRYMSTPIWMFVFVNSGIHSLMYVYFLLSALNVKVPNAIKRTLTTMQITQFVWGVFYAAAHLFVRYDIPIQTAYKIYHPFTSIASVASSTALELAASATSAVPVATLGALLKRILLRAAGDEGVAENVKDHRGQLIMPGVQQAHQEATQRYHEETRYRTEYTTVDCIDTQGQTFAIWLNVFYLAPLTVLFVRFFIRAYVYRTSSAAPKQTKRHAVKSSAIDAAKGTNREFDDISKAAERRISETADNEKFKNDLKSMKDGTYTTLKATPRKVSDRVHSFERRASKAKDQLSNLVGSESDRVTQLKEEGADAIEEAMQNLRKQVSDGKGKTEEAIDDSKDEQKPTSYSHLKAPNSQENGDASEDHEGDDSHAEADTSPQGSPEKKKKRRHKKKKSTSNLRESDTPSTNAERAGEGEKPSFADMTASSSSQKGMAESDASLVDVGKDTYQYQEQQKKRAKEQQNKAL